MPDLAMPPCADCGHRLSFHSDWCTEADCDCTLYQPPSVYFEQGPAGEALLVVRGSSLGTCLWELVAIGQGLEPLPYPDRLLRAFKEGREAEPGILARLEEAGWVLDPTWAQRTLELKCGGSRIVRLHPDAAGCPATQPTVPHVIEAKALHNSSWLSFRRHGIEGLGHGYDWQFACEMFASGLPLAVVALNKGETPDANGERPPCDHEGELHFEFVTDPPHSRANVIRRVRELAQAIDGSEIMTTGRPCDNPKQWPCNFRHLRPEPEKDDGYAVDQIGRAHV